MTTGKPRRKPEDGPDRPINGEGSTRSVTPPGGVPPEGTGAWVGEDASSRTGWVQGQAGSRWVDKTKSGEGWVEPAADTNAGKQAGSSSSQEETATFDEEQLAELATSPAGKRRLGDYELERKIGQGGMGEVWIARQVSLDRPVAVKVLPRSLANQENFIERFQREAKAAASLMHPNVLQIYSFGVHEGTPYFAMEYIEGEDLQQRMRRQKRLEWEEISQIMIGVGNALAVAHDKGLIHRDIKPSNIMIDKNGIVKVMDFGLAKAMSGGSKNNLTSAGLIMGTPNYLSPEQGRGDPLDGRSDLYSLGIVLYELCTGQLPFRADTPAGLIFKHVYEPPPPPTDLNPDIPKFMVEIMMKLLEKDPDDRYKTAHEFNADMTEFLANSSHFVGGGERSDSGGYSDAKLAAKSGGFVAPVTTGTRKKQEQRNAVTEGVKRREVEEVQPTDPEEEEAQVAEAEPEEEPEEDAPVGTLPKFPSRHVPRNQPPAPPPAKSKTPLILLGLLVAGGAGLWFGKPELVRGWGQQLGLMAPPAVVETGGVTVVARPSERVAYTLRPDTLQDGISAALLAPDQPRSLLRPNEEGVYATGEYRLELARLGYEPVSFPVRLARGDDGKGVIIGVDGNDPFGRDRAWAPTKVLADAYQAGRSNLSQKNYAAARTELQKAAALDPGFRPRLEDPTAKALLDESEAALSREQQTTVSTDTQLGVIAQMIEKRDWRAAEEFLAALPEERRSRESQTMLERARGEILRGDTIRATVEGAIERGAHGEAEKTLGDLADADPRHPQLAALGDRLDRARKQRQLAMSDMSQDGTAAAIGRLQTYLETFGKHDDEARRLLESLSQRLSQERLLGEDVTKLEAAALEKNWHEVRRLAVKVLKDYPNNAAAQRLRSEAESQLSKGSIEEVLAALDQALVRGSIDDAVAVLDRDSPSFPAEREALAAMAELQARFTSSEHREVQVTIEDKSAMVVATWEFGLQLLGEAPKTLLAQHHVRLRRLEGGRWLVTELRVEGGIRAKQ